MTMDRIVLHFLHWENSIHHTGVSNSSRLTQLSTKLLLTLPMNFFRCSGNSLVLIPLIHVRLLPLTGNILWHLKTCFKYFPVFKDKTFPPPPLLPLVTIFLYWKKFWKFYFHTFQFLSNQVSQTVHQTIKINPILPHLSVVSTQLTNSFLQHCLLLALVMPPSYDVSLTCRPFIARFICWLHLLCLNNDWITPWLVLDSFVFSSLHSL